MPVTTAKGDAVSPGLPISPSLWCHVVNIRYHVYSIHISIADRIFTWSLNRLPLQLWEQRS